MEVSILQISDVDHESNPVGLFNTIKYVREGRFWYSQGDELFSLLINLYLRAVLDLHSCFHQISLSHRKNPDLS